jgi:putative nucleotidyltransferase with HDIG domain
MIFFVQKNNLNSKVWKNMVNYEKAKEILKKYVKDPKVILHSEGVSNFSMKLSAKIKQNCPELKIDKEKIRIAALLHDIGKEYQEGHEERSQNILEKEGLGEIAKISIHGLSYFRKMERNDSRNSTEEIENKIVVYSDLRFKFSPVAIKERLEEGKRWWKGTPEEINKRAKHIWHFMLKLEKEIFELTGEEI